ncbi:UDP-N-acetyl-D-glucosamine 2-epimerase, UDP-hydrolysing [Helicobacter enhydrae]|uniref:UDP-N-acetyl-D-glucosamine 2-epimerase, UDP-hydrolysing n=1 Tax=Helicobacter enhydrae TaxID=222136 RepID=A0A1B1U5N8_9HELI|nr:UDP-N-acetylglucosamine 2-epimerase [Helicobacter enhydrae]ANV98114.1 UDP-N-acetyl-D-glucosamine 2-epimerase, UDP-hydrolysing [Helicobacter enhydrae]
MRKIVFVSGTRADWGKIKPLIQKVKECKKFEYKIFACGMHLLELYGKTFIEIFKDGFDEVFLAKPYEANEKMDLALGDCIKQFSRFVSDYQPDLIVVHGDRLEALAGAIVGAFNNIFVAHIEGGELSGTIDESIRHSISKLAHLHFVANQVAQKRLLQLGEKEESVFVIGSPDLDVMCSDCLPSFQDLEERYYQIQSFGGKYAIFTYHPVTTENAYLEEKLEVVFEAIKESKENFVIIYPNNDLGSSLIIHKIEQCRNTPHFVAFSSIKFEYFLTLLKNASFIIGNSSAGVREAPFFGIPCVNIGTRQEGRFAPNEGIIEVAEDKQEILQAIKRAKVLQLSPSQEFGEGKSASNFMQILENEDLWNLPLQKKFVDFL